MTASSPIRIDAPWLAEPARARVFQALAAKGFVARAVGGAVRDSILGLPFTDVDLATPATPQQVMAAAQATGLKALPTGLAHGTVTILVEGMPTQVTTLRRDVETHGRHATVAFTRDWTEDASRRDFTMNALYCDADGTVHDPLGGIADLRAGRVRFIGDATMRIREDYLRILRFFRFNAKYGHGALDAEGLSACVNEREGLARLSGERVHQELRRLLEAPRAGETAHVLFDFGLLALVLGRAPRLARLMRLIAIEKALGAAGDFVRRLAALTLDVAEDACYMQDRLKLSNVDTARLLEMSEGQRWTAPPAEPEARRTLYRCGTEAYVDRVLFAWACRLDVTDDDARWHNLARLPQRWTAPRFPLTGADAKTASIPPGPEMGEALRAVEQAWVDSDFALDRDALIRHLRQWASDN